MEDSQRIHMLQSPEHLVDVVIDTDTYNEVDDQFALAHHLMTPRFDVRGIVAGHFWRLRPGLSLPD